MKKAVILVSLALLFLLSGCVLSQSEIEQAQSHMRTISQQLTAAGDQLNAQSWQAGQASVEAAENTLSQLEALVDEAEARGEEQETIDRLKAGAALMHKQFDYVIDLTSFLTEVEEMKTKLEALTPESDFESITAELEDLIAETEAVKAKANEFISAARAYAEDYAEDAQQIQLAETVNNIETSLERLNDVKANLQNALDKMP